MPRVEYPRPSNAPLWVLIALLFAGLLVAAGWIWKTRTPANGEFAREIEPRSERDPEEREAIDLFKASKESVVNVDTVVFRRSLDRSFETVQAGTGSGFIWDERGRIVTNYHVVKDAIQKRLTLRVVLADRTEWKVDILGVAPEYDLAVLRINAPPQQLRKIRVGTSKDLEVGQKVYAIGNPFGLSLTLTKGIISALDREIDSPASTPITGMIQIDAPINPGNSGGPLLDKDGRLIGVNTAIATPKEGGGSVGIGFAVPVDTVNWVVPQLIQNQKLSKPDLGVRLVNQVQLRRIGYSKGVMIAGIEPNSPAAEAGLKAAPGELGDLILQIDGEEIRGNADFDAKMNKHRPGDKVRLTVERGGKSFEVEAVLRGV